MIESQQIKKKFVRFPPHVYEVCRFLEGYNASMKSNCNTCRVILMRDRFPAEEFHRKVESQRNVSPYILPVDSAGCNMNCWSCYAHQMIKKEYYDKLDPVFNTPEELSSVLPLISILIAARHPGMMNRLMSHHLTMM